MTPDFLHNKGNHVQFVVEVLKSGMPCFLSCYYTFTVLNVSQKQLPLKFFSVSM